MVKSLKNDRMAPPLMHAFREAFRNKDAEKELDLRDDTGERIIASRRVQARSWANETALRRDLAEDLTRLLNTVNLASAEDLSDFSYVARSIVN
jgi:type VI secretion system protein ImpF